MEFYAEHRSNEPGLYAGDKLIASWKTLVGVGVVTVEDSTLVQCRIDDPGILVLPEGIVHIANNAFCGCPNIYQIVLPMSIKSIASNAFDGCIDLEGIVISSVSILDLIK